MRSMQDIENYQRIYTSGLLRKVIGTFIGFSFLSFLVASIVGYCSLTFLPTLVFYQAIRAFTFAMILFAFIGIMLHIFVVWQSLAPLRQMVKWVNAVNGLEEIPALQMSAPEVDAVLNIINLMIRRIKSSQDRLVEMQRQAAIANTTQMLAHDIRKPFSMLKSGMIILQSTTDPTTFKSKLKLLSSEIDRATKSVDGMISDVMEIGSTSTELIQEPVAPESLIEATLGESFRVYPKSKIQLSYDLKHTHMVNVHLKKIGRVFSNIVGNSIQAMNNFGSIWFKTRNDGKFVEFCLGNAGSLIPPESLPKLFEAFFTSGKKGGTGLGLAIAQKVVLAHGGKIWCESSKTADHPDGKVEFFFTLPIAPDVPLETTAHLPKHSDEITEILQQLSGGKSEEDLSQNDLHVIEGLKKSAKLLLKPIGILIIDDESIYRSALAGWIETSTEMAPSCKIFHAGGSSEAFAILEKEAVNLVITDIDMGPHSLNGFELVKRLKKDDRYKGLVFIHSNRIVPSDHRKASDLGADGFLPKPMAKGQFLRLILQTVYHLYPESLVQDVEVSNGPDTLAPLLTSVEGAKADATLLHTIAIIDDEAIFRDQWPIYLKGFHTVTYANAEDFIQDWSNISDNLIAVLTDKYLGAGMDGMSLGALLRKKAPDLYLFLSSSDIFVTSNVFDLVIDKDAFEEAPKVMSYIWEQEKGVNFLDPMRRTLRAFEDQANTLEESCQNGSVDIASASIRQKNIES
jgi:signal transduction histidine kinase/DNA-binding NarL/FixJ family response regulator